MRRVAMVVAGLCGVLGGCATLDRGSTDRVYIQSDPPGAKVTLSTGMGCVTPCNVIVSRRDEFTVTIEKDGYEPRVLQVRTRLNATGVGDLGENLINGGAGAVVDVATGAALEHVPNPISVTLRPLAKAAAPRKG